VRLDIEIEAAPGQQCTNNIATAGALPQPANPPIGANATRCSAASSPRQKLDSTIERRACRRRHARADQP
jgi:hypothetical protein